MSTAKRLCVFGLVILTLVSFTGCSLFGPSLHGKTHVAKAIDGAKQIQATKEGKEVNEKLVEMFNAELVLAYQETEQAIMAAKADVSLYVDMPIESYEDLATLYGSITSLYGGIIVSAVDYPALVKDLDKKASKELFEAAKIITQSSDDYDKLNAATSYLKKATALDSEYEAEANEILIDVYIRLGDTKIESVEVRDIEAATSFYNKALTLDKTNTRAADKLAYAKERLVEIKVISIRKTLESGKTYQEFNEALRTYRSLGSNVGTQYRYLEVGLEKKLTADILVCVGPDANMSFRSPQETTPSWPSNVSDKRPRTIVVEYEHFRNLNIQVPTSHTYVLVPDADFGKVSYTYDRKQDKTTLDSADSELERVGYRMQLEQDPNNEEARKALATGTYVKYTFTAKKTINDVYHVYKVENGVPKLLDSTSPSVYTRTFEQYRFITGSKVPIEKKTGITFDKDHLAGDEFDSTKMDTYFEKQSTQELYARKVKDIKQYYGFLW